MNPAIIFPPVEPWAMGYLRTVLPQYGYPNVPVSHRRTAQDWAVWVRRDGGPAAQVTEDARLGVNVFAPSEDEVDDLARVVSALMRAGAGHGPVKRVREPMGPTPVTDNQPRRYMTYVIRLKGETLNPA